MAVALRSDYLGSRACRPTEEGYIERDGVHTFYEVYGPGEPTILFLPTWSLVHSRVWRGQLAYFARHFRVITFDGRGNGRSDRPLEPSAYRPQEFAADALAVLDATGTDRALTVSLSAGTAWNLILAALHPQRVEGAMFVSPTLYAVCEPFPEWSMLPFNQRFGDNSAVSGQNRYFIRDRYADFARYWARLCLPERHSTRALEIAVGMALDTTGDVVLATVDRGTNEDWTTADRLLEAGAMLAPLARSMRCPTLVVQGELDPIALPHWARALANDTGGELVLLRGTGHLPNVRKPVRFNLELRRFAERIATHRGFRAAPTELSRI